MAFFLNFFKMVYGSRVLDLGCGRGRHTLPLAQAGMEVVGVDLSPYLISLARQTCIEFLDQSVFFHVGDMRHLTSYGMFDYIFSFFTSFGYFPSDEENEQVLRMIASVLKPNGHFVLDYLHPGHIRKVLVPHEVIRIDGEKVTISRKLEDDCVIKTISYPDREYQERVKLYSREVLEGMFSRVGLIVRDTWGSYDGRIWSVEGPRQVFHCTTL